MNIVKAKDGFMLELALEGRLESSSAPSLEEEIKAIGEDTIELTLNFTKLEYVSSAGLRVILIAQKKMSTQGRMKIKGVNKAVMQVLEMTKMTKILTIV